MLKIVFIGDEAVGKTSIITNCISSSYNTKYTPTEEPKLFNCNYPNKSCSCQIWDTPGKSRFISQIPPYLKSSNTCLILYDITCRQSFLNLDKWLNFISENTVNNPVIIIIGNKKDLKDKRQVSADEAETYAKSHNLQFLEISVKGNENFMEKIIDISLPIVQNRPEYIKEILKESKKSLVKSKKELKKIKKSLKETREKPSTNINSINSVINMLNDTKKSLENQKKSIEKSENPPKEGIQSLTKNINSIQSIINSLKKIKDSLQKTVQREKVEVLQTEKNLSQEEKELEEEERKSYESDNEFDYSFKMEFISTENDDSFSFQTDQFSFENDDELSFQTDPKSFENDDDKTGNKSNDDDDKTENKSNDDDNDDNDDNDNDDNDNDDKTENKSNDDDDNDDKTENKSNDDDNDDNNNDDDNDDKTENKSIKDDDNDDKTESKSIKDDDKTNNSNTICTVCQKAIEIKTDIFYCCGYPYHIECIQCRICHKKISDLNEIEDSIVCVAPGLFLCRSDFDKYRKKQSDLPDEIKSEYLTKIVRKGIDRLFTSYINYDDSLLTKLTNSSNDDYNFLSINKDIQLFVPSITFHFSKKMNDIDYNKIMNKLIPEDMIIINIESGSTFLTIAFISSGKVENTEKKYQELFEPLKKYFHSAAGNSIAGNFKGDPIVTFPNKESIKNFFKRESINLLQLEDILDQINFKDIQDEVETKLRRKIENTNWKFIFTNQKMYNEAEESIRNNIENNEFELIITGITIIASKDYERLKSLAQKYPNTVELFLYHGSQLQNHSSIIKKGFKLPDENPLTEEEEEEEEIQYIKEFGERRTDEGYFGKGFYATDNIFYASMYSTETRKQYLNFNETGSVICCKTIYNNEHCINLNDYVRQKQKNIYEAKHIFNGNYMNEKIVKKHGAHIIYVESSTKFHPRGINDAFYKTKIKTSNKNSYVTAFEYVFPKSEQIIPVFSVNVMRPRFFVLWFNKIDEFDAYLYQINYNCEFNIYCKENLDEAVQFVERKKRNKLKLIVSVDKVELCKEIIDKIRKCHHTNFICIIFSTNLELMSLASSMENVLFTDQFEFLMEFVKIKLEKDIILQFSQKILEFYDKNDNKIKFNINENNLLEFHENIWDNSAKDDYIKEKVP